MVIKKCEKCLKGFRCSKEKDLLCAQCTVGQLPRVENVAEMEREFRRISERIYGTCNPETCPLNVDDVFNHSSRLGKLKAGCESIKSTKERQKTNREVTRLIEEHDALQDKLKQIKNKAMSAMLMANTVQQIPDTSPSHRLIEEHNAVQDKLKQIKNKAISVKLIANAVHRSPEPPPQESKKLEDKRHPLIEDEPQDEELDQEPKQDSVEDELMPLKRSNSVKNRIQAFEALCRRASTGTFDRGASPRRKLKF